MATKVKPLRIGSDGRDKETDPATEYLSGKGLSFEDTDTHLAEKLGDVLSFVKPDFSQKVTYNGDGTINFVEWFKGATQTTINRRAKNTLAYDANLFPLTETLVIYSPTDGTTILRTITLTNTYTGADLTSANEVTT